jgi:lipopolysaccharide export system protein LptC
MTRLSQLFPLLLLASLLGLTFWLDQALQQGTKVSETVPHDPDFIIEKIVAHRMDVNGDVKHTLYADRMTHYPDDDTTDLMSPRFISSASKVVPVTITSRTAKVSSGGEQIDFETDVRVVRAAYADRSELVLETSLLRVTPDENTARTDRPVTITDAHTVAHAIGLELNSETRIAKFLSDFKGTYHDQGRADKRR